MLSIITVSIGVAVVSVFLLKIATIPQTQHKITNSKNKFTIKLAILSLIIFQFINHLQL